MSLPEMVYVKCEILSTAFSSERGVRITQKNGEEILSAVPAHYCRDESFKEIPQHIPQKGEKLSGYVRAKLLRNGGDEALLSLPPDNTNVLVSADQVLREEQKEPAYVPLG